MVLTKQKLKEYFDYDIHGRADVTLDQITKELKVGRKDFEQLEKLLSELEDNGWIEKSFCSEHNVDEYNPGQAQGW